MAKPKRIYLDQMFGRDIADGISRQGHNVVRASDRGQARADDRDILERAIAEERILVTLDEHFGDWVVLPLGKHRGVVRIKMHPATAENIVPMLLAFLDRHDAGEFIDHLVILSPTREKWIRTG